MGPWGRLEYFYTYLDPPECYLEGVGRELTEWVFLKRTRVETERLLSVCGVDLDQLKREGEWVEAENGNVVRPPNSIVSGLDARGRVILYKALLEAADGASWLNEFVIERGAYRENCQGLNIPEEVIELVENRSIKVGRKTIFAETAWVLGQIEDNQTKIQFLKSLCRNRSLVARLCIDGRSNLPSIAKWWRAGPNRNRALPLLEAALETGGVDSVDLLHLLPPVPRRLLNTYPTDWDSHFGSFPDCYWAAMNFFSESVSSRYFDESVPRQYYFADGFRRVKGAPQFGDVTLIVDLDKDKFIHAYIHIADDIVFTKNGSGRFFPYVMMRRNDVYSRYLERDNWQAESYRLKITN